MKRAPIAIVLAATAGAFGALSGCTDSGPNGATVKSTPFEAPDNTHSAYGSLTNLPDWTGVWEPMLFARPGAARPPPPAPPQLTAKYAPQYAAYQEKNKTTPGINFVSDVANCVPPGLPGSMQQPYPIEFLFTPGRVTILIETYSLIRRIDTDGAPAPAAPDPSYQGTSVGHWDGETLVVETTAILPETSPMNGINGHSDKLKVTERIRLTEPDVLEIVTSRDDPDVFIEPYTTTAYYQRHRDWKIMEYVCAQNNRDFVDEHGNPGFRLDRKPGE